MRVNWVCADAVPETQPLARTTLSAERALVSDDLPAGRLGRLFDF